MNNFAVVYTGTGNTAAVRALKKAYPGAYEMVTDRVYLVRDSGFTADVAVKAGIKSSPRLGKGAAFKLNTGYSGYTARTLWEWLDE